MFKFFESLTQALPQEEPTQPPNTLYAFCRHYTRGFGLPLIIMSVLTAIMAMLEVSLFGFSIRIEQVRDNVIQLVKVTLPIPETDSETDG